MQLRTNLTNPFNEKGFGDIGHITTPPLLPSAVLRNMESRLIVVLWMWGWIKHPCTQKYIKE